MKNKRSKSGAAGRSAAQRERTSRRNVLVLASLFGALVLTSVLLLALAPAPLTPDAVRSLYVPQQTDTLDSIFDTQAAIAAGHWRYIYIHHSRGHSGNAVSLAETTGLADHFLIGNGSGCDDGEIQIGQRWHLQQPAIPAGGRPLAGPLGRNYEKCVTICLVGDFDQTGPTANQLASLQQLVRALQGKLGISADSVLAYDRPGSWEGIGRRFPTATFSSRLLR